MSYYLRKTSLIFNKVTHKASRSDFYKLKSYLYTSTQQLKFLNSSVSFFYSIPFNTTNILANSNSISNNSLIKMFNLKLLKFLIKRNKYNSKTFIQ